MVNDPTPEDVIAVRFHLLHIFPAELAQKILDDAEYWPRISSVFEPPEELRVAASRQNAFIASKCCVLTPPIPDVEGVKVRTRCVRFRIRSHDQGWGGEAAPGALPTPRRRAFTDCVHYLIPQGRTRTLSPGSRRTSCAGIATRKGVTTQTWKR